MRSAIFRAFIRCTHNTFPRLQLRLRFWLDCHTLRTFTLACRLRSFAVYRLPRSFWLLFAHWLVPAPPVCVYYVLYRCRYAYPTRLVTVAFTHRCGYITWFTLHGYATFDCCHTVTRFTYTTRSTQTRLLFPLHHRLLYVWFAVLRLVVCHAARAGYMLVWFGSTAHGPGYARTLTRGLRYCFTTFAQFYRSCLVHVTCVYLRFTVGYRTFTTHVCHTTITVHRLVLHRCAVAYRFILRIYVYTRLFPYHGFWVRSRLLRFTVAFLPGYARNSLPGLRSAHGLVLRGYALHYVSFRYLALQRTHVTLSRCVAFSLAVCPSLGYSFYLPGSLPRAYLRFLVLVYPYFRSHGCTRTWFTTVAFRTRFAGYRTFRCARGSLHTRTSPPPHAPCGAQLPDVGFTRYGSCCLSRLRLHYLRALTGYTAVWFSGLLPLRVTLHYHAVAIFTPACRTVTAPALLRVRAVVRCAVAVAASCLAFVALRYTLRYALLYFPHCCLLVTCAPFRAFAWLCTAGSF